MIEKHIMSTLNSIQTLEKRVNENIIGQQRLVNRLILGLLANGNVLLESLPGLAKTRAIKSLAKELDCGLSRIQFTPDLLPSDVTGTEIYQPESEEKFLFQKGPIFSNLILADEINRAPAKVQSSLLEAMEERQVSIGGKTYKMDPLFMVLATQNPIEQEGTYPLPEAQMDRFLMHIKISYPDDASEVEIMRLNRGESKSGQRQKEAPLNPKVILEAREEITDVSISEEVEKYIVSIISATRYPEKYNAELASWIEIGASPRGTIAIDRCCRVNAWMNGRDHAVIDDVRNIVHDCLRHRIKLSYEAIANKVSVDKIIDKILQNVAVAV